MATTTDGIDRRTQNRPGQVSRISLAAMLATLLHLAPFGVLTERGTPEVESYQRETSGNRSLVLFDRGDQVTVQAGPEGVRFLLVSGQPIQEPVAWWGPIVMNTHAELEQAIQELREGTFIRA